MAGPKEYAPWQVTSYLSASLTGALCKALPQLEPQNEGKCQLQGARADKCQLQGERKDKFKPQGEILGRQPPEQTACALNKPPLTRTRERAIAIISVFLILISSKSYLPLNAEPEIRAIDKNKTTRNAAFLI